MSPRSQTRILLLDCYPQEQTGEALETILASLCLNVTLRREVVADLSQLNFDLDWLDDDDDSCSCLIFLVLSRLVQTQRLTLIRSIKNQKPGIPIIVVIDDCGADEILDLLTNGAADFIAPPLTDADTLPRTWRLLDRRNNRENAVRALKEKVGLKLLIGKTRSFIAEVKKIPLIATCDSRVLITGETGTGKEMCARAIHYLSPRNSKPFMAVNCGAMPVDLVENELFGHERGAFTGANSAQAGLVEEAEGGTLFLDEIDCLPLMAQVKLLRFLQDKEYRRLGSAKSRHADVRMIVASNAVLEDAVQRGDVRQDLYYRLNVVSIALPPLRERRDDISLLAHHFLEKYATAFHKDVSALSSEAIQKLTFYNWPGNVRELEHTIERAVVFSESPVLGERDIVLPTQAGQSAESFQQAKAKIIAQFEKDYIQTLLLSSHGNISRAAQVARKNRRAFWELIRKHRINVLNFKPGAS